jgi:RNA polymerase sigma-70 factor (sigma-E family)
MLASVPAPENGSRSGPPAVTSTAGNQGSLPYPDATPTEPHRSPRGLAVPAAQDADGLLQDLYRAHALTLIRVAKLLLRDQQSAEDVVQDAFLSMYRALPRLSDHDQLLPYLRTAVINGSRSVLRARGRAAQHPLHDPPAPSAESAVLASEGKSAVMAAVARLPRRSREVVVLRYYLDLPDHEIATALGVSRGTVSSTASRAVAAIARELKEEL